MITDRVNDQGVCSALGLVRREVPEVLDRVDSAALDQLVETLRDPERRWFFTGRDWSLDPARCGGGAPDVYQTKQHRQANLQ